MVGKNEKRSPEVRERECGRWDLTIFNIFTKVLLSKCYLKIDKKSFLNLVFKHPKLRNVI